MGKVFFHLVESKKEDLPFAFLATYSSSDNSGKKSKHLPLKNALIEYGKNSKKLLELLSTVNKASNSSKFINELVESGEIFHPLSLSTSEAYTFLKEIPLYEESGILCRIPNWWKNKSESVRLSISVGNKEKSRLNLKALVDFHPYLLIGDDEMSLEELKKLLSESEGLAYIKGKWVEVNHEKLQETIKAYELAQKMMKNSDMTMLEAMKFQLNPHKALNIHNKELEMEITNGDWLNEIISKLKNPDKIESSDSINFGTNFNAKLRPYQERGLNWLNFMKNLGLGACLADDMGLGKTVQVIALLNYIRSNNKEKNLLVVPASLVGNWINEINKFAPSIKYSILHPSGGKSFQDNWQELIQSNDVLITTYGMMLKLSWLKEVQWNTLILDEAQGIKNPNTKQSKAIKQLNSEFRIAMTGTPIENRLSDLWSLFDFLNKGLLGTSKEFTTFTKELNENKNGFVKLKKVVSPFILRRLKTDKNIITDLPEKIEMKSYCNLTKKQIALYEKLIEDIKYKLESTDDGIARKGLILSSLMKFKQICNHPSQYLGQNVYDEIESGKFDKLREICQTIHEKRERVLVFTQFKEMTEPISDFLQNVFLRKGLILHGETAIKKRQDIVAKFQGEEYIPFLVLSIKAGGVGLNLTKANHVIHFDRWWNPAVENQATDRAFRIGQKKNVVVHKFISSGTIEEKIDQIIEEKTQLSKDIIPDIQESWITELDNKQLINLFSLSKD
jgi:non-specific serine/threonine protein kinase